jgi:hypothetical protein
MDHPLRDFGVPLRRSPAQFGFVGICFGKSDGNFHRRPKLHSSRCRGDSSIRSQTVGEDPTTVTRSRWPGAFTRRTQKPESSLKNVTCSMRPEIRSECGSEAAGNASTALFSHASISNVGKVAQTRAAIRIP